MKYTLLELTTTAFIVTTYRNKLYDLSFNSMMNIYLSYLNIDYGQWRKMESRKKS